MDPIEGRDPSSRKRRLVRRDHAARIARQLIERDAAVHAALEPGEAVVARGALHRPVVTDRRIIVARRLPTEPNGDRFFCDAIPFGSVIGWALGREHDGRPVLRLEHALLQRYESCGSRHRFLFFAWGSTWRLVPYSESSFCFARDSHPVLVAMIAGLERTGAARASPFVVEREATPRAERVLRRGRTPAWLMRSAVYRRMRRWMVRARVDLFVQLHWWLRGASWLVFAGVAWLFSPWLAIPAVLLAEVLWMIVVRLESCWEGRGSRGDRIKA